MPEFKSLALEALEEFRDSITDVYTGIINRAMDDDEGWAAVGEALTELRKHLSTDR